jgi:hypothetical protein
MLKTKLLAAGIAFCLQYHVDCTGDLAPLDLALLPNSGGLIGVPVLDAEATRQAQEMCDQDIDFLTGTVSRVNGHITPIYLYEMYDGDWGTEFLCEYPEKGIPMSAAKGPSDG